MDRPDSCLIYTLCGLATVSLPVFTSPNHLPFGAQLVARRYNDPLLLVPAGDLRAWGLLPANTNPPIA